MRAVHEFTKTIHKIVAAHSKVVVGCNSLILNGKKTNTKFTTEWVPR